MSGFVQIFLPSEVDSSVLHRAPVAILNHDLAVLREAALGDPIELPPGVYTARTSLPDGRRFEATFDILEGLDGKSEPVILVDAAAAEKEAFEALADLEGLSFRSIFDSSAATVKGVFQAGANAFHSARISREAKASRYFLIRSGEAGLEELYPDDSRIDIDPSAEPGLIRLERTGKPDLNVMLPTSHSEGARVRIWPGREVPVEARLWDEDAELLRRYLVGGQVQQLSKTLEAMETGADRLLDDELERPIAAAVAAYAKICVGAPFDDGSAEQFSRMTHNLAEGFPWLADGLCIHGEVLSRLGAHSEALRTFLRLPDRPLPVFSLGLRFALDRLQACLYTVAASEMKADLPVIERALAVLWDDAAHVDFRQPNLTFTTGPDGKPGDKPRAAGDPVDVPSRVLTAAV